HTLGLRLVDHRLLGNQDRHRGALRIVILARDVEDVGSNDLGHVGEDLGQPVGVVDLVDVFDITAPLAFGHGKADVIDVEGQGLGEIVEALQLQARQRFDHGMRLPHQAGENGNYAAYGV